MSNDFIGFLVILVLIAVAYDMLKVNNIHKQINSRMDKLLEITAKSSRAEGVIEGAQNRRITNSHE